MRSALVFVSLPLTMSERQARARDWIYTQLSDEGLIPRSVGVSDCSASNPLRSVCVLASDCSGGLILGFEQTRITSGRFKPDTVVEASWDDVPIPSPWNQLEAGILSAMRLPLLVIREPGITGGVFDPGAGDHFVNTVDLASVATPGTNDGLRRALRSWASDVRATYQARISRGG